MWGSEGSDDMEFNEPHDIAVDSSGNIFVADAHNSRIQKFGSFRVTALTVGSGSPTIEWSGKAGEAYQVLGSLNLLDWTPLGDTQWGSETGINSWTDDGFRSVGSPLEGQKRFYRVQQLP